MVPIYTLEYYAAVGKREILPFVTTYQTGGHILSEVSQIEKDCLYICIPLCVKSRKTECIRNSRMVITRGWEVGELERCWLKRTHLLLEDE